MLPNRKGEGQLNLRRTCRVLGKKLEVIARVSVYVEILGRSIEFDVEGLSVGILNGREALQAYTYAFRLCSGFHEQLTLYAIPARVEGWRVEHFDIHGVVFAIGSTASRSDCQGHG